MNELDELKQKLYWTTAQLQTALKVIESQGPDAARWHQLEVLLAGWKFQITQAGGVSVTSAQLPGYHETLNEALVEAVTLEESRRRHARPEPSR